MNNDKGVTTNGSNPTSDNRGDVQLNIPKRAKVCSVSDFRSSRIPGEFGI